VDGATLTCSEAQNYTWFLDGEPIPEATGPVLEAPANGSYWVVADLGDSCIFTTDTVVVISTGIVGELSNSLVIYPDPAFDQITLSFPSGTAGSFSVHLLDLSGRIVRQWQLDILPKRDLYVGDVPAGRYFLRVSTPNAVYTAPLGVMR
ncbi:MAG: T9SS type A sorting domain-containing protein, partial [Flavobacteriales bacterium]